MEKDDQLWRIVEPLDIILKKFLKEGIVPYDDKVHALIRELPERVKEVNAAAPVDQALKWLEERAKDAVSPVSTDGRRALDILECRLQWQKDYLNGVHDAFEEMNQFLKKEKKTENLTATLAVVFYYHVGRWSNRETTLKPLHEIELEVRIFAHDWHKVRE